MKGARVTANEEVQGEFSVSYRIESTFKSLESTKMLRDGQLPSSTVAWGIFCTTAPSLISSLYNHGCLRRTYVFTKSGARHWERFRVQRKFPYRGLYTRNPGSTSQYSLLRQRDFTPHQPGYLVLVSRHPFLGPIIISIYPISPTRADFHASYAHFHT
jgi:hypothetical protein